MSDRTKPIVINQKRFVRLFKDTLVEESTMRFSFILGAGASRSSGIQTQSDLILRFFNEITEDLEADQLQRWLTTTGINKANLCSHYQQIIKKRFEFEPEICDKVLYQQAAHATPGLGYLILAQILDRTSHNLAITCNNDYLIEDALFSVANKAPMFWRTSLDSNEFIQQKIRPLVHRLYSPSSESKVCVPNDNLATDNNAQEAKDINFLKTISGHFRSIFIGHSGNQSKMTHYLSELSSIERRPLFWCSRNVDDIPDSILEHLMPQDYIVEIEGFDQLMLQIIESFSPTNNLPKNMEKHENISLKYFRKHSLIDIAKEKAAHYKKLLNEFEVELDNHEKAVSTPHKTNETIKSEEEKPAQDQIDDMQQINDFMSAITESTTDEEGEEAYKHALKKNPLNTTNNVKYAIFLEKYQSAYSKSAEYYKTAIRCDPDNEKIKALYAYLLNQYIQDYDEAEKLYNDAYELAPENIEINILYGIFLHNVRKKYMAAEKNFKIAHRAAANDIDYTDFVKDIRMDYQTTEAFYIKTLEESFTELPLTA